MNNLRWTVAGGDGTHRFDIPATVPGCLHTDLENAGIIGDYFWRKNADDVQWIENCDVTYTGLFEFEKKENAGYDIYFFGLDVYAEISLNGVFLGEADDMFVTYRFPAEKLLINGTNRLEVRFRSPIKETRNLPARAAAFTCERLYTRRIQCTYGWDWVNRFVTVGIWRPVEIAERKADMPPVHNRGIYVATQNVNRYSAQIRMKFEFENVSGNGTAEYTVLSPAGTVVYHKSRRILKESMEETVDIPSPELWWPCGYGDQPLYTLVLKSGDEVRTQKFGIREAVILEIEDAAGSVEAATAERIKRFGHLEHWDRNVGSSGFILLINDEKIFCRGANWVPCEPFPSGEKPEKISKILTAAKRANVNMIRVWGGGIFENNTFYDECDRLGILVTQDFLMACGNYPEEDPDFIRHLNAEAEEGSRLLRNHPCLVWWSGDNENAVEGSENDPCYTGKIAAEAGIEPVLKKHDPYRRFLPSSPYGGLPYASCVRGTTHNTQYLGDGYFKWIRESDGRDYKEYFDRFLSRFCAEQPAIGMPYVSSLRKFMTEEDIFGNDTSVSEYHTKNNPGLGEVTLYGYVDTLTKKVFGDYKDGRDRVYKMQLVQCEWVRLSLELFRRHQWYSSGIVYWMLNDCWPAANGWSFIDYYAKPKPAYYVLRRCAGKLVASVSDGTEEGDGDARLYVSYNARSDATPCEGHYRIYVYNVNDGAETTVSEGTFGIGANETGEVARTFMPVLDTDRILMADIETNLGRDRAFILPKHRSFGEVFREMPDYTEQKTDTGFLITANNTVPYLILDKPEYDLDGSCCFVKKGETVRIGKRKFGV